MAKAYIIIQITVTNPEAFMIYKEHVPKIIKSYGGKYLVRGGHTIVLEGKVSGDRNAVIEFPNQEAALNCYNSPEYQAIIHHRKNNSVGYVIIVEEYIEPH